MSFRSQPPSPEGWHSHLRHGRYWWCSPGRCLGRWGHSEGESQRAACAFRSPRNSGWRPNSDSNYLRSANEMKLPIHFSLTCWIYGIPSKQIYGGIRVETDEKMSLIISYAEVSADLTELGSLGDRETLLSNDFHVCRFEFILIYPDCIWAFWSFCWWLKDKKLSYFRYIVHKLNHCPAQESEIGEIWFNCSRLVVGVSNSSMGEGRWFFRWKDLGKTHKQ